MKKIASYLVLSLVLAPMMGTVLGADASTALAESKGVVSLTFDDGNTSQYEIAGALLNAADQNGVFYVNSGYMNTEGYLTWAQLTDLKSQGHEIAGHTLTHVELPTVNQNRQRREINNDFNNLTSHGLAPVSFAVPFGAYDNNVTATVAKTYNSLRAFANQGLNVWPYNKYLLYVRYITNQTSVAEVESWVAEAQEQDAWLVLVFHEILPVVDATDDYSWETDKFQQFLSYLNDQGIKAKTIQEALVQNPNLIQNGSFENGMTGWTTNALQNITINTANNGSYPSIKNSLRLTGVAGKSVHLFGDKVPVSYGTTYGFRAYTDSRGFQSGEVGFYIDEYDVDGNWVSGKWLGAIYNQNVIDKAYAYTPTSANVATMAIQIYVDAGTKGAVFVDNLEFFSK